MADPFLGEIRIFGCNFAPNGWAACDGQLIPIGQNSALFSLLGTAFGGNGVSSFALPDLRNRFAVGIGGGAGLTERVWGETGGSASVTLQAAQMPAHDHRQMAALAATGGSPELSALAPTATGAPAYHAPNGLAPLAASALSLAGGNQPHENRPPLLALNFCIALQGVYPARP
jgi:microcystin-dependent protein